MYMRELIKNLAMSFIALAVLAQCSHEQLRTYLLETDQQKNVPSVQSVVTFETADTPISQSDEFSSMKSVYSFQELSLDSLSKRDMTVLIRARKDLETFYLIARYLRKYNKKDDLMLFESFAREYMGEGIDSLLKREADSDDPEVKKTLFEMAYLKALLLYEINDLVHACETMHELDIHYTQDMNVDLDFIAGRLKTAVPHMVLAEFMHQCNNNMYKRAK